jgi:methylated-DNA-[protein]-cysteine S-methyltransferase
MRETETYEIEITSPLGPLSIVGSAEAVESIGWNLDRASSTADTANSCPLLDECVRQLQAYFDGRLTAFDLPIAPAGTNFQQRVWQRLMTIPFGQTLSYGQLAETLQPRWGATRFPSYCRVTVLWVAVVTSQDLPEA